jgi:putative ABC transport system permease protein
VIYLSQILEQACLIFPLVLGIYLSFGVLKIADLSVDGTFVLGASVFGVLLTYKCSLVIALLMASCAGLIAGVFTALIQRHERINPLIAGILMAFILNSASLVIMQRPNLSLLSLVLDQERVIIIGLVVFFVAVGLIVLLSSRLGLWLKAFGNNQALVALLGRDPEYLRVVALSLANACAALSGALTAFASGYADINMGFGQALIGIAMILIGKQLLTIFKRGAIAHDISAIIFTFIGVLIYFVIINIIIYYGLNPVYIKMAIGIVLILFMLLASDRVKQGTRSI